jgi:hypothetical protein
MPKDQVQRVLEYEMETGYELIRNKVTTMEEIEELKRQNFTWVYNCSNQLKECFTSESPSMYFASQVYLRPSIKLDDLERELEEFPTLVRARIERLKGFLSTLPVIPEPPCGEFVGSLFHSRIFAATWRAVELAQHRQAIQAGVQEVEAAVRDATQGGIPSHGPELVHLAFDPSEGPLTDRGASEYDRIGTRDLFVGFMLRYRQLPQHAEYSLAETSRILALATYLMYTIDLRRPLLPQDAPSEFELLKDE